MPRRVLLAFLLAPLAAIATLTAAGALSTGATAAQAWHGGTFFSLLGLPVAYGVELLIGLPLYTRYAPAGGLGPATVIGVAGLAGAVVMPLVSVALLTGQFEWVTVAVGAAMGAAAGATFVLIAGRTRWVSSHLTYR
jgi:hypothetical protein